MKLANVPESFLRMALGMSKLKECELEGTEAHALLELLYHYNYGFLTTNQ